MSTHSGQLPPGASSETGFDATEPKVGRIVVFAVLSVVFLVVCVLGLQFYVDQLKERKTYERVLAPVSTDLQMVRDKENAQLYSYGYIDREKGQVRLPIARAMELIAQEAASGKLSYPAKSYPVQSAATASTTPATPVK